MSITNTLFRSRSFTTDIPDIGLGWVEKDKTVPNITAKCVHQKELQDQPALDYRQDSQYKYKNYWVISPWLWKPDMSIALEHIK